MDDVGKIYAKEYDTYLSFIFQMLSSDLIKYKKIRNIIYSTAAYSLFCVYCVCFNSPVFLLQENTKDSGSLEMRDSTLCLLCLF